MLHSKVTPEIHNLGEDDVISEPGFYNLPLERHHSQPCEGPSVTSSQLRTMATHDPETVWSFSPLNPNRYQRNETDALLEGRAMAAIVEGGITALDKQFIVIPADRPNRPSEVQKAAVAAGTANRSSREAFDFWRKVELDGRAPISQQQFETLVQMGEKLAQTPVAVAALNGLPEITMAWFDETTQLWVLSRPDVLTFDGMNTDYKKVGIQFGALSARFANAQIKKYRLDMQLGLAAEAMEQLGLPRPTTNGFVFQMDTAPFSVRPHGLSDDALQEGINECQAQRRRFRDCLDAGHWPGPEDDIQEYRAEHELSSEGEDA